MATMNHVQMNGINPGGPMAMTNGANGAAPRNAGEPEPDMKTKLNTHIYDYLLKNEQWDVARALLKSSMALTTTKSGAPRRPNGMDDSSMEDSKDDLDSKKPADLPLPDQVGSSANDNSFLLDWFSVFWDIFLAPRNRAQGKPSNPFAMQFMEQTRQQSQIRQQQQNQFMRAPGMQGQMPPGYQNMMRMNQGMPMSSNDLRQRAGANNARLHMTPQQQQQLLINRQMMMQQQERAGSEVDMNGRPRTPSSGDNAPSPSKRPRIDGGPQFPGQAMMANGRFPPGMAGQQVMRPDLNPDAHNAQQLLLQHNIDPASLSQRQLQTFVNQPQSVQETSIRAYANSFLQARQNMPAMAGQGGPMIGQVGEDYYAAQQMRGPGPQNGPNSGGNHALQDYQMQLMLLEQQNKKRLLMARQEQDNIRSSDGQPLVNQSGAFAAPNMSPQGSRSGPSPNPSDMKREDGKMGPMGGSPLPDNPMAPNRSSPGPMNFNPQNMPMEMIQAQMKNMGEGQVPPNMRPPSSNPFPGANGQPNMDPMRAVQQQPAVRMANGTNWQQGPPSQAPSVPQVPPSQQQPGHAGQPQPGQPGQQAQMGTPQPRNAAMPPPNVPAGNNAGVARPASPSHSAAAGTPQQSNKPNPKKNAESKKKPPKKKNTTTGAAPMETEAAAQTPAPATPMTPQHQNSFNDKKANPAQATNAPAPPPAAAPAAPVGVAPNDPSAAGISDFGGIDNSEVNFQNLDFGGMDSDGVFENIDFSAFVQEGEDQAFMPHDFGGYANFDNMGEPQPTDV